MLNAFYIQLKALKQPLIFIYAKIIKFLTFLAKQVFHLWHSNIIFIIVPRNIQPACIFSIIDVRLMVIWFTERFVICSTVMYNVCMAIRNNKIIISSYFYNNSTVVGVNMC